MEAEAATFLKTNGLEQYSETLVANGYDDLDVILEMTKSEMGTCGITLPGHIKKFIIAIQAATAGAVPPPTTPVELKSPVKRESTYVNRSSSPATNIAPSTTVPCTESQPVTAPQTPVPQTPVSTPTVPSPAVFNTETDIETGNGAQDIARPDLSRYWNPPDIYTWDFERQFGKDPSKWVYCLAYYLIYDVLMMMILYNILRIPFTLMGCGYEKADIPVKCRHVISWLEQSGMAEYAPMFEVHNVDGRQFVALETPEQLAAIGVTNAAHVAEILAATAAYRHAQALLIEPLVKKVIESVVEDRKLIVVHSDLNVKLADHKITQAQWDAGLAKKIDEKLNDILFALQAYEEHQGPPIEDESGQKCSKFLRVQKITHGKYLQVLIERHEYLKEAAFELTSMAEVDRLYALGLKAGFMIMHVFDVVKEAAE